MSTRPDGKESKSEDQKGNLIKSNKILQNLSSIIARSSRIIRSSESRNSSNLNSVETNYSSNESTIEHTVSIPSLGHDEIMSESNKDTSEVKNVLDVTPGPSKPTSTAFKLILNGSYCKVTPASLDPVNITTSEVEVGPQNDEETLVLEKILLKTENMVDTTIYTMETVQLNNNNNNTTNTDLPTTSTVNCSSTAPGGQDNICSTTRRTESSESCEEVCRICHDNASTTIPFITPCICKGTMGLVHQKCLERWLGESGKTSCEICGYDYAVERRPKYSGCQSIWSWIRKPTSPNDTKNLFFDVACFFILTPLASVSAWLCVVGSQHYALSAHVDKERFRDTLIPLSHRYRQIQDASNSTWTSIGLLTLTGTLLTAYYIWLFVAFRYHYQIWKEWQNRNFYVTVLPIGPNLDQCPEVTETRHREEETMITIDNGDSTCGGETNSSGSNNPKTRSLPILTVNNSNNNMDEGSTNSTYIV